MFFFVATNFGFMGLKSLLFHLLLSFRIQPYEKTQIPLKFVNSVTLFKPQNGIQLELQRRF